jgi:hypothetical protein
MKNFLISTILVALATSVTAQTIVDEWSFSDLSGTLLENTLNTGTPGTAAFPDGLLFTTNGSGQYVVGNGITGTAFQNFTPSVLGGVMTYEIVFGDWDLDNVEDTGENFRNLGITLRDTVAGTNILDLQMNNRTTDRLRFRFSTSNGDYSNSVVTGFDDGDIPIVNTGTAYSFLLLLDTNTGAYSAQVKAGAGVPVVAGSGILDGPTLSGFDAMRLYIGNNDWGSPTSDNFINIDSITITSTVPEPSTFVMVFGLLSLGFVAVRRRLTA